MVFKQIDELNLSSSILPIKILLLTEYDCCFSQGIKTLLHFYKNQYASQIDLFDEIIGELNKLNTIVKDKRPDLILFNVEQTQKYQSVWETISQLAVYPTKILVLSELQNDEMIFQVMQAGAYGYVCKDNLIEQLPTAITTVLDDRVYLAPTEATKFFRIFRSYKERSQNREQKIRLTEREQEVLHLLVEGASNRKISEQLYITVATVKAHLTSIFDKFDVSSRTQAIVKAFRLGLV